MQAMTGSGRKWIKATPFLVALLLFRESRAGNVLEFDGTKGRIRVSNDDSFASQPRIRVNGM